MSGEEKFTVPEVTDEMWARREKHMKERQRFIPKVDETVRGFGLVKFKDSNEKDCSIQESSSAEMSALWLGQGDERMHLSQEQAKGLIWVLRHFAKTGGLPGKEEWAERQAKEEEKILARSVKGQGQARKRGL